MQILYRTPTDEESVFIDIMLQDIPDGSFKIVRIEPDEVGYGYFGPLDNEVSSGVVAFEKDNQIKYRTLQLKAEGWHNLKQGLYERDDDVTEP